MDVNAPPPASSVRALAAGLKSVARAPLLLIVVTVVTAATVLPFAVVLGSRLQASLASQPPVALAETEIDPEWWLEFRTHATGLAATFTPVILGFAAPLDAISGVLDGRRPPLAVAGPLVATLLAWAFLWGGILHRFDRGRGLGWRAFLRAGLSHLPRFIGIAVLAAAAMVILYLTVHAVLFGPVVRALTGFTATERDAFIVRVLLYVVFLAPLAWVGLVADYARVASATGAAASLAQAVRKGLAFVSGHLAAVFALALMTGLLFAGLTLAYGAIEIYGGAEAGGWRAVAIGQAYIVGRLAIRLTAAAAGLHLFRGRSTTPQP